MRREGGSAQQFVFVDTSAFFALLYQRDQNHGRARVIHTSIIARRATMVPTNFVLAETHALLLSRLGGAIATRHLFAIDAEATLTVRVSEDDERAARATLAGYTDRDFALTDATSFAVMDRLDIREAFTFDHHFRQYGLTVLEPA
jgi:predicted nucleic acid-binding protein